MPNIEKKQIQKFREELYKRSLQETLEQLDIKGERVKLIIQLVLGALLLGFIFGLSFLRIRGYQDIFDYVFALVIGMVVTAIIIFVGLGWGAKFIARGSIFRVATKIHYEQEDNINNLEAQLEEIKKSKPILRIKDYGNERKAMHQRFEDKITGDYDTLYVDVYNQQTKSDSIRVWSKIEWIQGRKIVLSHHGRWHIATSTIDNEPIRENLQYRDIYSNQSVQRLYFAWSYHDRRESGFHGLERDMDGRDSWGTKKYLLNGKEYKVRITLQGNEGVHQEFMYAVKNDEGGISIGEALTNESKEATTKGSKRKL